jgi:protocatechuate 3,4-dioxygenase beta subunit
VEAGDTNVVIELFELATVSGTVVDGDGRPLSKFVVKARASNEISPVYGAVVAQKSVSDSSGRFELSGLPEGSYVVEGLADGYASCFSEPFTATQGLATGDVVVRMTHGGSLTGKVLDAYDNSPVAGAEITTHENDWVDADFWEMFGALEPSAMTKAKVFTDQNGEFTIDVMTPGTYQVQIRARGFAPEFVRDVQIVDGQNIDLPSRPLIKGASISGIVYGRDSAVASGATVQLSPTDLNEMQGNRQTRSDGTGRFAIESVRPGTYTLTATRPAGGAANPFEALADMKASEVTLTIEDGGRYEMELYLGSRRGN